MADNIISGLQRSIVQSIKNVQRVVDDVQKSLATGKDVNSVIDDPQNFFLAQSLSNRAADLSRLIDGISLSIRTVEETQIGIQAILKLLDLSDSLMNDALLDLFSDVSVIVDPNTILENNTGVVYNEDTNSFYRYVATPTRVLTARSIATSSLLAGGNDVFGHLTNITSAEENTFIGSLVGSNAIWIGASDAALEGRWEWLDGPEAGLNFWNGDETGSGVPGTYNNWRSADPDDGATGQDFATRLNTGLWDDFGPPFQVAGTNHYVIEWDGNSIGVTNDPSLFEKANFYREQYLELLSQIDQIARDTNILGLGLLVEEDLRTDFNENLSSFLTTEGINATSAGFGLTEETFLRKASVTTSLEKVRAAKKTLELYSGSLSSDLSVITTRQDFTQITINTLKAGANDLVVADQNEKGADMLALQTRQQLQFTALSLSNQSSVLSLFS